MQEPIIGQAVCQLFGMFQLSEPFIMFRRTCLGEALSLNLCFGKGPGYFPAPIRRPIVDNMNMQALAEEVPDRLAQDIRFIVNVDQGHYSFWNGERGIIDIRSTDEELGWLLLMPQPAFKKDRPHFF